jgi:hypothetical protein
VIVFMLLAGHEFRDHVPRPATAQFLPALPARSRRRAGSSASPSASVFGIAIYLHWAMGIYPNFLLTALRHAACSTWCRSPPPRALPASITTCGPIFAPLWMLFLSSFATSAGSTGGGIKMIRAIILYKQVYRELMRSMHPNVVWPVRIGGDPVPQNILFAVLAFGFVYMCSIVALTLLMSFSGLEIVTAFYGRGCQHQQHGAGAEPGRTRHHL